MSEEKVVVRQSSDFRTEFLALDPQRPESAELRPVKELHGLTPYGMLLASLGSCTAIVLHTYAQHHGLDLQEVELALEYKRVFKDDCEHCEEITDYKEHIGMELAFKGKLSDKEREKLFLISRHCPIHKMLASGIKVQAQPALAA